MAMLPTEHELFDREAGSRQCDRRTKGATMQEYLGETPRLRSSHRELFLSLTATEVARVATRLEQDLVLPRKLGVPHYADGEWLFKACMAEGLDHAGCVLPLCRESDSIGISALEKLVGRPIHVWRPRPRQPRLPTESGSTPRPASGGFSPSQIVLSVVPNPKKAGSATWHRYKHWVAGDTVAQCMARGLTRADVQWDSDFSRGFVKLGSKEDWDAQVNQRSN